MSRSRPRAPIKPSTIKPSTIKPSTLAAVLGKATRATERSVRDYLDLRQTPSTVVVGGESWRLIHLLGALGEFATALAIRLGEYPQHHVLHADDGGAPAQHIARACRGLAELRRALDDAQRAARQVYTALSHLEVRRQVDRDGSAGRTEPGPAGKGG